MFWVTVQCPLSWEAVLSLCQVEMYLRFPYRREFGKPFLHLPQLDRNFEQLLLKAQYYLTAGSTGSTHEEMHTSRNIALDQWTEFYMGHVALFWSLTAMHYRLVTATIGPFLEWISWQQLEQGDTRTMWWYLIPYVSWNKRVSGFLICWDNAKSRMQKRKFSSFTQS